MHIIVKAPLKTDDIQQLLDGYTSEGLTFRFESRKGFEMTYEVLGESTADAADMAKSLIRSTDYGKALYISVLKK